MKLDYYPDTDSLYIELNPGRERKQIDNFASRIVELTKLGAEGPVFGLVRPDSTERRVS